MFSAHEVPRRRPRQLGGEWLRHLRVLVVENLMERIRLWQVVLLPGLPKDNARVRDVQRETCEHGADDAFLSTPRWDRHAAEHPPWIVRLQTNKSDKRFRLPKIALLDWRVRQCLLATVDATAAGGGAGGALGGSMEREIQCAARQRHRRMRACGVFS